MTCIAISVFAGEVPAISARLLETANARDAVNCNTERGEIAPLREPGFICWLKGEARTIYPHPADGWLEWDRRVNVVKSSVHDVSGDRQLGHLLMTGAEAWPSQYLAGGIKSRLALPRPLSAPKVELSAGAIAGMVHCYAFGGDKAQYPARYGNEEALAIIETENVSLDEISGVEQGSDEDSLESEIQRSTSYCYTYVRSLADGIIMQESAPSPSSPVIDVPDGEGVRVSGFIVPEIADLNISHIRIYRTLSGNESSEFHFLCEVALPCAEVVDMLHDRDVSSEVLQTETWDPIPDDAMGLVAASNGIYAAFRGNELLLSVPFCPYAFPEEYRLTVEDSIVALSHTDNTIIVLTEGRPWLASGSDPGQMQLVLLPIEQACVSALSVATVAGGTLYASPDGLMLFSANDQGLVTENTFTREQWRELGPERLMGAVLDGRYYGFFADSNRGFIFSLKGRDVIRIELPEGMRVTALRHHSVDDCIYLAIEKDGEHCVAKWDGGEGLLEYVWRSKPFFMSRAISMTALRVEGDQKPGNRIMARLFGPDRNRERQRMSIADTRARRTRPGKCEKEWSIEVRGRAAVREIRLATGLESLEYGN